MTSESHNIPVQPGPPVAIIIGATSGIGKETALQFASNGYHVVIGGRRVELLHEIADRNPGKFTCLPVDITDKSIPEKLNALISEFKNIEVIIICSGIDHPNPDNDPDIDAEVIRTNVNGFTSIVNYSFQILKKQRKGHLGVITSVAGIRGNYLSGAYHASKAYQINYLEGLRLSAEKSGLPVCITDIRPGYVSTSMMPSEGAFWIVTPEEAACQIVKAIQMKKKIVYVSKRWRLIAAILKFIPYAVYKKTI
jgi:short-subunit dehydrogenase